MTIERPMFPPVDQARRHLLTIAAGGAVAAAIPAAAMADASAIDPIFAAIDEHRKAQSAHLAAIKELDRLERIATISFGATVVGKMHTAGLKGEPLAVVQSEIREEWLETLNRAIGALATVAVGLTQAINTLKAQSETSDFPVKLPVSELGQPVLNLAAERDQ
jgi:hypothetical protein